jgi:hypothetical protein
MRSLLLFVLFIGFAAASCKKNKVKTITYYESMEYYGITDSIAYINFGINWCQVPYPHDSSRVFALDLDRNNTIDCKLMMSNGHADYPIICESYTEDWQFVGNTPTEGQVLEFATQDIELSVFRSMHTPDTIQAKGSVWSAAAYLKKKHPENYFAAYMPNLSQVHYLGFRIRTEANDGWNYGWMSVEPNSKGFYLTQVAINPNIDQFIIPGSH